MGKWGNTNPGGGGCGDGSGGGYVCMFSRHANRALMPGLGRQVTRDYGAFIIGKVVIAYSWNL